MDTNEILILFDYNYWARQRIMRAAFQLSPDQFSAANTSSYGSLRGTLVHNLSAEINWRNRLQGGLVPFKSLLQEDYPTPQTLEQAWLAEETRMRAYLETLTAPFLQTSFEYKNSKGDVFHTIVWGILLQLVNHGTQHRSEAAAMLTDFSHSPGDIDLIVYLREKGL